MDLPVSQLPIHPKTGARALGMGKRGPIWPVMGGDQTVAADLIVPAVWSDMVQAEFLQRVVYGNPANGFTLVDDRLAGQPGDEVHFPKWEPISELDDLDEQTPMITEKLRQSDATAKIKETGKAVEVTDKALLTGFGDPLGETRRQFGVLAARKADTDLITSLYAAGTYLYDSVTDGGAVTGTAAANLSWHHIAGGIGRFGDEWDPAEFAGIVIHSAQHTDLLRDPNFLTRDKLGEQATIARGVVGEVGGVRVYMTDRVPLAAGKYSSAIVKRSSLGLMYKRRPLVEQDRDILARSNVITTNIHYASKRLMDRGVTVVTTEAGQTG